MKKKRNKPSLPLPLPSPSDKNQSSSTTTTSSSSSSSAFSSFSSTPSTFPSPSPAPSPYHFSSFSVPFAWERKPGVPFTPLHPHLPPARFPSSRPLPLPPSKVKSLDNGGNLAAIRRRRIRGLEVFLALIGRLAGLDPYCSCKSVATDDVADPKANSTTSWTSRRRYRR